MLGNTTADNRYYEATAVMRKYRLGEIGRENARMFYTDVHQAVTGLTFDQAIPINPAETPELPDSLQEWANKLAPQ